jgi:hypothetical protein
MDEITFESFPKMARLSREAIITEKLDGTNAQIIITNDGRIGAASRNRLITPENDNYGFAAWVQDHKDELLKLGPGRHFGEWWGSGIQRGYGLTEKRFSLFNVSRWTVLHEDADGTWAEFTGPSCCYAVPTLFIGPFDTANVTKALVTLQAVGSLAAPGFMRPEGIVIYHTAARMCFKKTLEHDEKGKSE